MPKKSSRPVVKLFRAVPTVKDLLSPEAINNRFVESTSRFTDIFFESLTRETREERERRAREIMAKKKCSHRMALAIVRREDNKAMAEYNSPLKVAERRIAALERHLEEIKEHINDPDYLDKHSEP